MNRKGTLGHLLSFGPSQTTFLAKIYEKLSFDMGAKEIVIWHMFCLSVLKTCIPLPLFGTLQKHAPNNLAVHS
jgi:hypothetical protein